MPEPVYPILKDIGAWLDKNGYAIYETRPAAPFRKGDIAYTGKNGEVYAIYLPKAENNAMPATIEIPFNEPVKSVTWGGKEMEFSQMGENILVNVPTDYEKEVAYVFTLKK